MQASVWMDAATLAEASAGDEEMAYWSRARAWPEGVRIVAVEGNVRDWAAYVGGGEMDAMHVYRFGDKISRRLAERLFPYFAHLKWRD